MTRKPKYAVIALNDSVDVGSFFNLLMTNGYTNVTFLTNLAEHSEVKKLINGTARKQTPTKEKSPPQPVAPVQICRKSPEPILPVSTATATATVNITPSTSLLSHPILTFDGDTKVSKYIADGSNYIHCKLCDNKIMCSRLSNLTNHVRRHSSVKQYSCVYCPYQHNEMSKVRTHMASQHGDTLTSPNDNLTPELQKIWCAYMEKCFPGYLDSTGKTGRNALEVFGGRTLARMECSANNSLTDDEIVPLFEKLHNCVECGDAIAVENGSEEFLPFMEHIREKHSEYCTPYKCGECSFLAAYEYMVRGHIATKHAMIAADVEVHLQPKCEDFTLFVAKFFPSLDDVVPDITEELKAFMDTAGRSDDSLSNGILVDSVKAEQLLGTDSGNENTEPVLKEVDIDCKLCGKIFEIDASKLLIAHSKEHYCIKQFECPSCSFGSNDYDTVFEHVNSVHCGEGIVIDQNGDLMQQAWMLTMKCCFPDLIERQNIVKATKNKRKRPRLTEEM